MNWYNNSTCFAALFVDDPPSLQPARAPRRSAFDADDFLSLLVAPVLIAEAKLPRRDLRSRAAGGRDAH